MTTITRAFLAVAVLAASAGASQAQQTNPATSSKPTTPISAVVTGSCTVEHTNAKATCTDGLDQGGCRASGMEAHAQADWKAGGTCP